jgi:magnesium transporter
MCKEGTMLDTELEGTIRELLEARSWTELRKRLADMPAPDTVDLLRVLEKPERGLLFRILPRDVASEVFAELETGEKDALLKDLTDEETRRLLANLDPDDRTELLEELPGRVTQRLLNLLSPEDRAEARQLLGYPEGSVGRLMNPDYVAVRPDWTVGEALHHIRRAGRRREEINTIYVTDASWRLIDALALEDFILPDPDASMESIMDRTFVGLSAFDDQEHAARQMQRYDLFALPVVDSDGVLIGVVTVDDVLDVVQEEVTEDFQKVGAISPLGGSYREAGIRALYRKRIVWLSGLVIVSLGSSGVIAAYEETLAAAIALAFFIPLLIGTGGNTGAQAATLMVRALATGDVDRRQWLQSVLKEIGVGLSLGLTLGIGSSALGLWRGGMEVGLIVGLTMASIVLVANLVGIVLPIVLTKVNLDPAVASSPLITTVMDVTGLLIYFAIASVVLGRMG